MEKNLKIRRLESAEIETARLPQRNFVYEVALQNEEPIEIHRDQNGDVVSSSPFDAETYSRMKYGDPRAIKFAAERLFQKIICDPMLLGLFDNSEVVFTNEARSVPTASYCIMVSLVTEFLNPYLVSRGLPPVECVKSERGGEIAADDYASLSQNERQERARQREAFFTRENQAKLKGKKVILFDDLVITGTYERNQAELLVKSGVEPQDIIPLYLIQVEEETGQDTSFEKKLNQTAVKQLDDLLEFFFIPGISVSERILKFVLPSPDLALFLQKLYDGNGQPDSADTGRLMLVKLYEAANSPDGFAKMDRLKAGVLILENFLKEKGLIAEKVTHREIKNFAVASITEVDTLSQEDIHAYSRMKYGDPIATKRLAIQLTAKILTHPETARCIHSGEPIVVTSSAFGIVPTASYALTREVTKLLIASGVKVERIKFNRQGDFATNHYGTLTAAERTKKMASRKISLKDDDRKRVAGRFVVVIDDINVTGSHERKLNQVLSQTDARDWAFAYLYFLDRDLSATKPETEEYLNRAEIKTVLDLLDFFRIYPNGTGLKTRLNSRALKFILSTEPESEYDVDHRTKIEHLKIFFGRIEDEILAQIYQAANSPDCYSQDPKFADGINLLYAEILKRNTISRLFRRQASFIQANNTYI